MDPKKAGYRILDSSPSSQAAVPSAPSLNSNDEPRNPRRPQNLQVETTTVASNPGTIAMAVPPPRLSPGAWPVPISSATMRANLSSNGGNDAGAWLCCCLCTGGLMGLFFYVLMYSARQDQNQDPVFSGIAPNDTCFNSSLGVFPNASLNKTLWKVELSGGASFLPGFPDTFCSLSMPNGDTFPFNRSLGTAFSYSFPNASSLIGFAKDIYLSCRGAAAALRLSGAVQNYGEHSPALTSIVQFSQNCTSFFSSLGSNLRASLSPAYE